MNSRARALLLVALSLSIVLGCTPKNTGRNATLKGTLKYKGAPVTGGSMTLYFGEVAYPAPLSATGTFSVTQIPEGDVVVVVNTEALNPKKPTYDGAKKGGSGPMPKDMTAKAPEGTYVQIPAKYKDKKTSDLKHTIKAGTHEVTWELKD
jgi:hypothetical protein